MAPTLPSLDALRAFEACARHLNFTRAAQEIGVSQAAMSLRMRELERRLGGPLFVRHGPRVTLTETGARLAADMGRILEQLRVAVDHAAQRRSAALRVSCTPSFARWLAPRLAEFEREPHACPVDLDASTQLRALAAGSCDVGVRSGPGAWPGVSTTLLFALERTPMLAPALAERLPLADGPACLLQAPLLKDDQWPDWLAAAGVATAPTQMGHVSYPTQDLQAQAALAGSGAALLTPQLFDDLLADGQLLSPFAQRIGNGQGYFVVTRSDEARPTAAAFVDWLVRLCGG